MAYESPFVLGLTGSIGMGKSETAKMFAASGIPVFDADAAVHELYAPGGGLAEKLATRFSGCVTDAGVDRTRLSAVLQEEPSAFVRLENAVHPLLVQKMKTFLVSARQQGVPVVLLNVPLLFEAGWDSYADAVVVVSTDEKTQWKRVLARPGMSERKLRMILARQMPDAEKRFMADYVVDTGTGLDDAGKQVAEILADVWRRMQAAE